MKNVNNNWWCWTWQKIYFLQECYKKYFYYNFSKKKSNLHHFHEKKKKSNKWVQHYDVILKSQKYSIDNLDEKMKIIKRHARWKDEMMKRWNSTNLSIDEKMKFQDEKMKFNYPVDGFQDEKMKCYEKKRWRRLSSNPGLMFQRKQPAKHSPTSWIICS